MKEELTKWYHIKKSVREVIPILIGYTIGSFFYDGYKIDWKDIITFSVIVLVLSILYSRHGYYEANLKDLREQIEELKDEN